jgi:hypothetical protein
MQATASCRSAGRCRGFEPENREYVLLLLFEDGLAKKKL